MSEPSDTKQYAWDIELRDPDPDSGNTSLLSQQLQSRGIPVPDFKLERERYGPHDWSAMREMSWERAIVIDLLHRVRAQKPAWTFPSPFVSYTTLDSRSNDSICWGPPPRTLAELRMYGLSWAIRTKPEWQRKISDSFIMDKWRKEALEQQENLPVEEKLTPNMVNYVLTELAGHARLSDPTAGIESGPFDAIWYSDRLISSDVSDSLRAAIATLEDVPVELKDWHPGSNEQVLDLVHPSLYPIVYGRTRFSEASGSALVEPPEHADTEEFSEQALSEQFCWLPSDFAVHDNGSVKLLSPYINNLHTKHTTLYHLIESILSSFVPLFERVLSQVNGQDKDLYGDVIPGSGRIKPERTWGTWPHGGYGMRFQGVAVGCIWEHGEPDFTDVLEGTPGAQERYRQFLLAAPKVLPDAYEEYTGELERGIAPYSLRGKTIQCIIKLANIHLTVENPEYKGGSWHAEGMINERIVASGIYYYDEDNISESRLAFRVTTSPPVYHDQDDEVCMEILYGMKRSSHCCQDLGSIATKSGRALAWPNIYQHRVAPFRLLDPTKPGHRKILAIFLVDPSIDPIPSATNIPPQQVDWASDALEEGRKDPASMISRLPPELTNLIFEQLSGSSGFMSRQEAEAYRLKLMEERMNFVQFQDAEFSQMFNMCEH
ncbi:hypothetical protein B0H11DRAFT_2030637 [Mycena galericulata]|nr:hypothetical protein B0H11DRAFT_2030637 [Mycena galericulata]